MKIPGPCKILRRVGAGQPTMPEIISYQPLGRWLEVRLNERNKDIISYTRMFVEWEFKQPSGDLKKGLRKHKAKEWVRLLFDSESFGNFHRGDVIWAEFWQLSRRPPNKVILPKDKHLRVQSIQYSGICGSSVQQAQSMPIVWLGAVGEGTE